MSKLIVIYDGQCQLCINSVAWVQKRLSVEAISYQKADLPQFDLSRAECERQVYVIADGVKYAGAAAVVVLLRFRGNKVLARLLQASGPVGQKAYLWVAGNRSSKLVRVLSHLLKR
jgi:predicted DCC family thiol-disulfide oxidoreductase YuxK